MQLSLVHSLVWQACWLSHADITAEQPFENAQKTTYLQNIFDQMLLLSDEALPILFVLLSCFVQHIGKHTDLP